MENITEIINNKHLNISNTVKDIAVKVINGQRISIEDCVVLYEEADLSLLGMLANQIREQKNGNYTYYNKNLHLEPTNICIHNCKILYDHTYYLHVQLLNYLQLH